jgi:hypothetical protein
METRESLYNTVVEIAKDLRDGKPLHDIAEELGEAADAAYELAKSEESGSGE